MPKTNAASFDMDDTLFIQNAKGKGILNPPMVPYLLYCMAAKIPIFINTKRNIKETFEIALDNKSNKRFSLFLILLKDIGINEEDVIWVTEYDPLEENFYRYLLKVEQKIFDIVATVSRQEKPQLFQQQIKENSNYKKLEEECYNRIEGLQKNYFFKNNVTTGISNARIKLGLYDEDNQCKEQQFNYIIKKSCELFGISSSEVSVGHIDDNLYIINRLIEKLTDFLRKKQLYSSIENKCLDAYKEIEEYPKLIEGLISIKEKYLNFDAIWQTKKDINNAGERWEATINECPGLPQKWFEAVEGTPIEIISKIGELKQKIPELFEYLVLKKFLKKWDFLQFIKIPIYYPK